MNLPHFVFYFQKVSLLQKILCSNLGLENALKTRVWEWIYLQIFTCIHGVTARLWLSRHINWLKISFFNNSELHIQGMPKISSQDSKAQLGKPNWALECWLNFIETPSCFTSVHFYRNNIISGVIFCGFYESLELLNVIALYSGFHVSVLCKA